jgi:hypothetical protein
MMMKNLVRRRGKAFTWIRSFHRYLQSSALNDEPNFMWPLTQPFWKCHAFFLCSTLTHCVFWKWSVSLVSNNFTIDICRECRLKVPVGSGSLPVGSFNQFVSPETEALHVMSWSVLPSPQPSIICQALNRMVQGNTCIILLSKHQRTYVVKNSLVNEYIWG